MVHYLSAIFEMEVSANYSRTCQKTSPSTTIEELIQYFEIMCSTTTPVINLCYYNARLDDPGCSRISAINLLFVFHYPNFEEFK